MSLFNHRQHVINLNKKKFTSSGSHNARHYSVTKQNHFPLKKDTRRQKNTSIPPKMTQCQPLINNIYPANPKMTHINENSVTNPKNILPPSYSNPKKTLTPPYNNPKMAPKPLCANPKLPLDSLESLKCQKNPTVMSKKTLKMTSGYQKSRDIGSGRHHPFVFPTISSDFRLSRDTVSIFLFICRRFPLF